MREKLFLPQNVSIKFDSVDFGVVYPVKVVNYAAVAKARGEAFIDMAKTAQFFAIKMFGQITKILAVVTLANIKSCEQNYLTSHSKFLNRIIFWSSFE